MKGIGPSYMITGCSVIDHPVVRCVLGDTDWSTFGSSVSDNECIFVSGAVTDCYYRLRNVGFADRHNMSHAARINPGSCKTFNKN